LLVTDLVVEGVLTHMLAEIQHPVAVVVGVAAASISTGATHRRLTDAGVTG
jgi:hypothetical protein